MLLRQSRMASLRLRRQGGSSHLEKCLKTTSPPIAVEALFTFKKPLTAFGGACKPLLTHFSDAAWAYSHKLLGVQPQAFTPVLGIQPQIKAFSV